MNVAAVQDALGVRLDTITGLRVTPYWVDRISSPAAIVGWPETITYDSTMARGSDSMTVEVFVLVATVDQRSARILMAAYLDGSGAKSVKAVIDGGTYTAMDSARVSSARVETMTVAGTEYLGAVFDVEITGRNT